MDLYMMENFKEEKKMEKVIINGFKDVHIMENGKKIK